MIEYNLTVNELFPNCGKIT